MRGWESDLDKPLILCLREELLMVQVHKRRIEAMSKKSTVYTHRHEMCVKFSEITLWIEKEYLRFTPFPSYVHIIKFSFLFITKYSLGMRHFLRLDTHFSFQISMILKNRFQTATWEADDININMHAHKWYLAFIINRCSMSLDVWCEVHPHFNIHYRCRDMIWCW